MLELFQKMHEEKAHTPNSFSLTNPKDSGEVFKEIQQERNSNDNFSGRSWLPAMVIHNLESKVREAAIGDKTLVGGHKLVYTATGDKSVAVRCLVPGGVLRHPTSIDDPIIKQYPKFTCDLNTINSIPPVGSILMVMWNNKNIRNGGIILGYALGGQKQQDDFTIFSAVDSCGEVIPNKMKTTHAMGESLPAENIAVQAELKIRENQEEPLKEPDALLNQAAPNSRWATTNTQPSGSSAEVKQETKKNTATPAEVPNTAPTPPPTQAPEIVCNKSYQLSETTEEGNGASPDQGQNRRGDSSNKFCRVEELAKRVGIPPRLLLAFMEVESKGNARAVRFEPHIFVGGIRSRNIDKARPDLRNQVPWTPRAARGGKDRAWYISRVRKETNRAAFNKAYALDPVAAIQSTSFGQFQVMGRSLLKEFKNDPAAAMRAYDSDPEAVSDRLLITWIEASRAWRRVAKNGARTGNYDFIKLATYYNGRGQAQKYGKLLKDAYNRLEGTDILCRDNIPANNPRPAPPPPGEDDLTLDSWVRGKFKGAIPAIEIVKDGPVASAKGKKGLVAKSLEEPIKNMIAAYKKDVPNGPPLQINSTYRSYDKQLKARRDLLKPKWREEYNRRGGQGNAAAERWLASRSPQRKYFKIPVARPGYSNHNSGVAVDFQTSAGGGLAFKRKKATYEEDRFYDHRAKARRYKGKPAHNWRGTKNDQVQPWKWMAENAHRYGFIRTVSSERWHFVYVGSNAVSKRFSKVKKNHGSWDGLGGVVPAKEKARRRREAQARRNQGRG